MLNKIDPLVIDEYEQPLPCELDDDLSLMEKLNKIIMKMNEMDNMLDTGTNVNDLMYYHNITVDSFYDSISNTNYTITTVPKLDENGNLIEMKNGYANDLPNNGTETARSFAKRKKATLTLNAAVYNDTTKVISGLSINKGVVVNDTITTGQPKYVLAWKTYDRTFRVYPPNTPSSTVLGDGYDNALASFIPMIDNGVQVDQYILDSYAETNNTHPRQAIGVKTNGDILFLSCAGRNKNGEGGMTVPDMIRIFLTYGVQMAYNLDGGGSTQTVVRGMNVVRPDDNNGQTERAVPHFLYFAPTKSENKLSSDLDNAYRDIGEAYTRILALEQRQFVNNVVNTDYIQLKSTTPDYDGQGLEMWKNGVKVSKLNLNDDYLSYYDYVNDRSAFKVDMDGSLTTVKGRIGAYLYQSKPPSDLNTITENGTYWVTMSVPNNPNGANSWIVDHYIYNDDNTNALQRATKFDDSFQVKHRRKSNGVWGAWT